MRTFKTLREIIDYIPNCLVCGKDMQIIIRGSIDGKTQTSLKMNLIENILFNQKDKVDIFSINVDSNIIIIGQVILDKMAARGLSFIKICKTCDFKIYLISNSEFNPAYIKQFPALNLSSEQLNYTIKKERSVKIYKRYYLPNGFRGHDSCFIYVNNKSLDQISFEFDFSKFHNLKQLNKRLSTIMVFQ